MIDLGFWAMGEYRVAGEDVSREEMAGDGGMMDEARSARDEK
jgi:endogenous inhibitor of DNA gyrase (YacG/DUF329 family)